MNDKDFTYYLSALDFLGINAEEMARDIAIELVECNGRDCAQNIQVILEAGLSGRVCSSTTVEVNWTPSELAAFAARLTSQAIELAEFTLGCDTLQ